MTSGQPTRSSCCSKAYWELWFPQWPPSLARGPALSWGLGQGSWLPGSRGKLLPQPTPKSSKSCKNAKPMGLSSLHYRGEALSLQGLELGCPFVKESQGMPDRHPTTPLFSTPSCGSIAGSWQM